VLLDQAHGNVRLKALGPVAGPFTPEIEGLIRKYAGLNGLPVELVRAVVQQESSGNPRSVSAAGAQGLMQLMPGTARGLGVTDSFDPEQNIAGGTKYLAGLMREFNNDIPLALAAYNAGPPAVRKASGIPNFAETKQYVQRILEMVQNSGAAAP
jgi:soluble lytic murein transglycosylase-like protein